MNRSHPGFIVLFLASVLCIGFAFAWSGITSESCTGVDATPQCPVQAEGLQNTATILAIGGLALMIGAVGCQVGRFGGQAAPPPQYPAPYPHGVQPPPPNQPQAPRPPQP